MFWFSVDGAHRTRISEGIVRGIVTLGDGRVMVLGLRSVGWIERKGETWIVARSAALDDRVETHAMTGRGLFVSLAITRRGP